MSKPNWERISLWVDDLRSGGHPQTRGALCDESGFCCLGRAAEVAIANGLDVAVTKRYPGHESAYTTYDSEGTVLPESVWKWFGFPDNRADNRLLLTNHNDDGATFPAIADIIEAHYKPAVN